MNTVRFMYDKTAAVQPGLVRLVKSVFIKGQALWNSQYQYGRGLSGPLNH